MNSFSLIFWGVTFGMTMLALCAMLPWISEKKTTAVITLALASLSYGLYFKFGSAHYLPHYYEKINQDYYKNEKIIASFIMLLSKEELRLRLRLEDNPEDVILHARILEIMSIKTIQTGQMKLALQYIDKALSMLPKTKDADTLRVRMNSERDQLKRLNH